MALSLYTAPSGAILTTAQAKAHLRVDHADEDALIDALVSSAASYIETFTHRALLTQTWDLKLDAFPCSSESIWLEKPPVSSVTSITYVDTAGVTQTWTSTLYATSLPAGPHASRARIQPAYAQYYPTTRTTLDAVTVRFVCGYGTSTDIPAPILAAARMLVGTWYGPARETVNVGNSVTRVPDAADALLWPFKAF